MKILITGSRDWTDEATIKAALMPYATYDSRYATELIHGGAKGADTIAGQLAQFWGWKETRMPANWERYGKMAGLIRNTEMLDLQPDVCIAFHKNNSRGTQDMIKKCKRAGLKTIVYALNDDTSALVVSTYNNEQPL